MSQGTLTYKMKKSTDYLGLSQIIKDSGNTLDTGYLQRPIDQDIKGDISIELQASDIEKKLQDGERTDIEKKLYNDEKPKPVMACDCPCPCPAIVKAVVHTGPFILGSAA